MTAGNSSSTWPMEVEIGDEDEDDGGACCAGGDEVIVLEVVAEARVSPHRSVNTVAGRALTQTLSEKMRRPGMSITSSFWRKKSAPRMGVLTPARTKS